MTRLHDAAALHQAVEDAFNAKDVDGLVSLYTADACLIQPDGSVATGLEAIAEVWRAFIALDGQMSMTTKVAVEQGDVALLSNAWTFANESLTLQSVSAEVAVRDSSGTWRYLIDNPFGGAQQV